MALDPIQQIVRAAFVGEARGLGIEVGALITKADDAALDALPNLLDRLIGSGAMAGFADFSRFVAAVGELASCLAYFEVPRGPFEMATLVSAGRVLNRAIAQIESETLPEEAAMVERHINRCLGRSTAAECAG